MRRALGLIGEDGGRGAKTQATARPAAQMRATAGARAAGVVVEHATLAKPDRPGAAVNRLAGLEAQLLAERQARAQAERSLRDAQIALQDARTKQAHAEMARQDAEARLAALAAEMATLADAPAPSVARAAEMAPMAPRRRGRPPKLRPAPAPEPLEEAPAATETEPVEWWQPGWKAKL